MKSSTVFFTNSIFRSGEFLLNLIMDLISVVCATSLLYMYWNHLVYAKSFLLLCMLGWYVMALAILRARALHGKMWEKLQAQSIKEVPLESALSLSLSVAERSIKDGLYFTSVMLSLFILVTIATAVRFGQSH